MPMAQLKATVSPLLTHWRSSVNLSRDLSTHWKPRVAITSTLSSLAHWRLSLWQPPVPPVKKLALWRLCFQWQDYGNSSALATEIPQSCTEPSIGSLCRKDGHIVVCLHLFGIDGFYQFSGNSWNPFNRILQRCITINGVIAWPYHCQWCKANLQFWGVPEMLLSAVLDVSITTTFTHCFTIMNWYHTRSPQTWTISSQCDSRNRNQLTRNMQYMNNININKSSQRLPNTPICQHQ